MIYTSQSATTDYLRCNRLRYFRNHHLGHGITSTSSFVPLVTGNEVHIGVQAIAEEYLQTGIANVETGILAAQSNYSKDTLLLANIGNSEQQQVVNEQQALIEILIRLWHYKEWPKLVAHYHILAVEQELTYQIPNTEIIYQSRPDLILIHKESGELINYSLKTIKGIYDRLEDNYMIGNQVFTEPYITQKWLEQMHHNLFIIQAHLDVLPKSSYIGKYIDQIMKFIKKFGDTLPMRTYAIRFCYLVKGQWKETSKDSKIYYTDNPFLYAYRKFSPSGVEHAWTQWTMNPQNKSGYGKLGKGWENFCTFAQQPNGIQGGVKEWFRMLADGEVASDIGDGKGIFDRHILSQPDVHVQPKVMERRVQQIFQTEEKINIHVQLMNRKSLEPEQMHSSVTVDNYFPMNTSACYFPGKCEYLPICPNGNREFKQNIADNPLNVEYGPMYTKRVPHHKPELISIQGMENHEK